MTSGQDVLVGKIIAAHGLKGWVRVFSYTRPPNQILEYSPWQLVSPNDKEEFIISDSRIVGKKILVLFEECRSRDMADELKARQVFIDKSQLPSLESGDFYWNDLVGMQVKSIDGIFLGNVNTLMETGANDVLVVSPAKGSWDGRERLIPYVDGEIIVKVDQSSNQITVNWHSNY
ncbi:ribosome maturation factor RimM [Gammaproteobacteria bacterium]|nr:ribosome maturation factor RimM [Gammaproteobacteria bacterium]